MTITTLTSRELDQDAGRARRAAENGPVIITDRGRPAHVLLSIGEYNRLAGANRTIADLLSMPEADDSEFDPPRFDAQFRTADFS